MQIVTGGIVSIEAGVKKNEEHAPPRKVRVELHFTLPEGTVDAQPFIDGVAAQADTKVRELLYGKIMTATEVLAGRTKPTPQQASSAATQEAVLTAAEPKKGPPRTTGKTKTELAEAAGLPTTETVHTKAKPDEDDELNAPAPKKTEAAKEPSDDLGDLLGEAEKPVEITDADLNKHVQTKSAEYREANDATGNVKIRELVATYNPDKAKQFVLREIPQGERAGFVAKLKAMKPGK